MATHTDVGVAHRDEHLLVLVKPPGLPTTAPDARICLARIARELDPRAPRLHPSSRLDAEVSGLVTFARTEHATRALLRARAEGRYDRTYLALALGAPAPRSGTWDASIAFDPHDPRRRVVAAPGSGARGAREARTSYRTVAEASGVALLELRPRTGRTHQLRVHAAHAGAPLLGDIHYDGPRRVVLGDGRVVTAARVMLHCARLVLPDIAHAERATLELASPVPADFAEVWARVGGDPSALG